MTQFLRLLSETDKAYALATACARLRQGETDPRHFEVAPESFNAVPGKPFAYWVSDSVRQTFQRLPAFESDGRSVKQGLATADDFRFVRSWWEVSIGSPTAKWVSFAKGGSHSPFHADVYLTVNWALNGAEIKAGICQRYPYLNGNPDYVAKNTDCYLRPGLTWPLRTNGLSFRVMPQGCIFGHKGPAAFSRNDDSDEILAIGGLVNSRAFELLVSVQLARTELAQSYEVGLIQQTPIPTLTIEQRQQLARLARRAWSLKRTLDTTSETSHAFLLPAVLRARCDGYDSPAIEAELARIQAENDEIAFDLYGFSDADRAAVAQPLVAESTDGTHDEDSEDAEPEAPPVDALLSWAVGLAFGRFHWRLATGERSAPPEPEPFDPLPAKSPGMLPDSAEPFHVHSGILVDDQGHPHDLAHLIEEVLVRVEVPVPEDVRRWLQRDFFAFHLQRYSKSRRKAPIYWPLATESGSYTLWLYYPSLTRQTLYTAVNDFVEPKLKQVSDEASELRARGSGRSRVDEKRLEALESLQTELRDLRDQLLAIASRYQPNYDDGVQITATPLWSLFRHKPWQKLLKETWAKLAKGDYDWAHLAMVYWPDRVREKCKTDKSLAIAHGLEELYVEPEPRTKKTRG